MGGISTITIWALIEGTWSRGQPMLLQSILVNLAVRRITLIQLLRYAMLALITTKPISPIWTAFRKLAQTLKFKLLLDSVRHVWSILDQTLQKPLVLMTAPLAPLPRSLHPLGFVQTAKPASELTVNRRLASMIWLHARQLNSSQRRGIVQIVITNSEQVMTN